MIGRLHGFVPVFFDVPPVCTFLFKTIITMWKRGPEHTRKKYWLNLRRWWIISALYRGGAWRENPYIVSHFIEVTIYWVISLRLPSTDSAHRFSGVVTVRWFVYCACKIFAVRTPVRFGTNTHVHYVICLWILPTCTQALFVCSVEIAYIAGL